MNDPFAHADLERFMKNKSGQSCLAGYKETFEGQCIEKVCFENHTKGIATVLHLSSNGIWVVYFPSLEYEVLRKSFPECMEIDPSPQ